MPEATNVTVYTAAKTRELFPMVVEHGADADVSRPVDAVLVMWKGTVTPNNMAAGDFFIDLSAS